MQCAQTWHLEGTAMTITDPPTQGADLCFLPLLCTGISTTLKLIGCCCKHQNLSKERLNFSCGGARVDLVPTVWGTHLHSLPYTPWRRPAATRAAWGPSGVLGCRYRESGFLDGHVGCPPCMLQFPLRPALRGQMHHSIFNSCCLHTCTMHSSGTCLSASDAACPGRCCCPCSLCWSQGSSLSLWGQSSRASWSVEHVH